VGDYAFLACTWDLKVVDISDPGNPQLLNPASQLYHGKAVVRDTLAYISGYQSVRVIDVSEPMEPILVAELEIPGELSKFTVEGHILYTFFNDLIMQAIDISDLSDPQILGSCTVQRVPSTVTIADGLIFISGGSDGAGNSGIQIIDVSNPENPKVCYTLNTSCLATGITVDGSIAYIAGRYQGMMILDITNPGQPAHLGVFNPGRAVQDISIQGTTACLANELNGVLLVDITEPASPTVIGACDTPAFAFRVAYRGNHAFVAGNGGLQIVNVSDPLPSPCVISLSNYPNPFNPETTISFDLAKQTSVTIEVFNLKGQKVKILLRDSFARGQHSVIWNGTDDNGNIVASGVYFTKMITPKNSVVHKMLLMK
jgi:hypothetical protein